MATAVGIRFPTGRYHAAPWDRHVNEAQVEWPPSPLRLLRALIATWHRKADLEAYPEHVLERLVESLAEDRPVYALPGAALTHTRHYMPVGSGPKAKSRLIHDAFLRLDPRDELVVVWPDVVLEQGERELLAHLAERIGYLGRAESLCECRLLDDWDALPTAGPSDATGRWMTGNHDATEAVELPAALPAGLYREWRDREVASRGLDRPRRVREKRLLATLPARLIDALRLDTAPVREEGWSRFPGTERITYLRPEDCFERPPSARAPRPVPGRPTPTVARLVLMRLPRAPGESPAPLPRVQDALRIGEAVRAAALRRRDGDSPVLSGHGMPDGGTHQHAFYLPEDQDRDGRIDHVMVYAPAGLNPDDLAALGSLERLWMRQGAWSILLEGWGLQGDYPDHPYVSTSRTWMSVTPYLHPWYRKAEFTVEDQLRKELALRGFPTPELERLNDVRAGPARRRPAHFHRFRRRRGLSQPDTGGSFWRLDFPEPVGGPLALGFACHFGLGMFTGTDS